MESIFFFFFFETAFSSAGYVDKTRYFSRTIFPTLFFNEAREIFSCNILLHEMFRSELKNIPTTSLFQFFEKNSMRYLLFVLSLLFPPLCFSSLSLENSCLENVKYFLFKNDRKYFKFLCRKRIYLHDSGVIY